VLANYEQIRTVSHMAQVSYLYDSSCKGGRHRCVYVGEIMAIRSWGPCPGSASSGPAWTLLFAQAAGVVASRFGAGFAFHERDVAVEHEGGPPNAGRRLRRVVGNGAALSHPPGH